IPAQLLLYRYISFEQVQRFVQKGQSCGIPPGEVRHQAIQKKIGCARSACRRRRGLDIAGHFQHTAPESQATGKHGGGQCLQVGRSGKVRVDRLEPLGGLQQQGRSVTAPIRDEREVGRKQVNSSLLHVSARPSLRDGQQVPHRVQGAGLQVGRRGGQRTLSTFL